jgi:hypothetical protein
MFHIIAGSLLLVVGVAMIFFARQKNEKTTWVYRFRTLGDLYAVTAVSFVVLGLCIAALG